MREYSLKLNSTRDTFPEKTLRSDLDLRLFLGRIKFVRNTQKDLNSFILSLDSIYYALDDGI